MTPTDRAAFADWLAGAPDNRAAYDACEAVMQTARGLYDYPDLGRALGLEEPEGKPSRVRASLIAASVAAALLIGGLFILWQNRAMDYATPVGERMTVALADGSTVDLNTDTALDVAFRGGERHVSLDRGEAFFAVAPDRTRPFVIETAQGEIRVLGTKFNVRADNGATVVSVFEGHVRVGGDNRPMIDLYAGDQLRLDVEGAVQKTSGVDLAQVMAWRRGQVYFDGALLADVVSEFNRYSPQKYALASKDLERLRLSGVFRTGDSMALLYALRESFGIGVRERADGVVYLGRPRGS